MTTDSFENGILINGTLYLRRSKIKSLTEMLQKRVHCNDVARKICESFQPAIQESLDSDSVEVFLDVSHVDYCNFSSTLADSDDVTDSVKGVLYAIKKTLE